MSQPWEFASIENPADLRWVRRALYAHVPRATIAREVIEKIKHTPYEEAIAHGSFTRAFLAKGAGKVVCVEGKIFRQNSKTPNLWHTLSMAQFMAAVRGCIQTAPNLIFLSRNVDASYSFLDQLIVRVDARRKDRLTLEAAEALTSFDLVSYTQFRRSPLEIRLQTLRRLSDKVPVRFLTRLLLSIEGSGEDKRALSLLEEFESVFTRYTERTLRKQCLDLVKTSKLSVAVAIRTRFLYRGTDEATTA